MKIVVDSNRVIASLLKDRTTREILYNRIFDFVAPEFIKVEILKYKKDLMSKTSITEEEFDSLLSLLFERITLMPREEYSKYFKELSAGISDTKDIPYFACSIATKSKGIWSHDPDFQKRNKVKIFTNIDLLRLVRS